uniref:AT-rich interactive domain-containing protein 5A isoform X2 n=1 Tax=Monopterus albus TaxID=43700 RepID=UPI0009B48C30|nr:AT-rich interactive domain-containing protein 5A isoform X2 [Monopterus albus]
MAQEDQDETSQQAVASDKEKGPVNQASPAIIEIHDSATECEEDQRPSLLQMEEKAFVSSLHSFMKDRGTPIERIPHLGFKQINLWRIYKAVEKLGGYDSVTARRLWKKVYDELGGSPGSTSAATCTRRHYEKHSKGEEDKPLPPSKPRKPYKRNLDGKVSKADGKRKRTQSDREMDSEMLPQRSSDAACQGEAVMPPHSVLWAATSDRHHPDCSQPNRAPADLCTAVYAHLLQVPTSTPWTAHIPSAAGEVISPLEKKKRLAQASLNLPLSPQSKDRERPSVIQCSQSPARASSSRNSSDGSLLPLSSSSSRSPSPYSVSSEDGPAGNEPASASEVPHDCLSTVKNTSSCSKSVSCSQTSKDLVGQNKDISHVSSQSLMANSLKSQIKDSAWESVHKASNKHFTDSAHSSSSFTVKSDWAPASTSSFTKVIPKSVQLLRPAPIRPTYKFHQSRLVQQDISLPCTKKLNNVAPWLYQTERRDKSRTMLQKIPLTQQSHSATTVPLSCILSNYDKSGRDSWLQPPFNPMFLPSRMRLPQSQLMYHHVPVGPAHSALVGSAVYPYPYTFPLLNPQTAYTVPAMNPIYPHKL